MIETLEESQIELGAWILRNDIVRSAWLEDKINSKEKIESFLKSWRREENKELFKIIL